MESLKAMQRRLLRETEAFLELGLRYPDKQVEIPAIPVGEGEFPPGAGDRFWSQVLPTS
jgi:hypothetical protein